MDKVSSPLDHVPTNLLFLKSPKNQIKNMSQSITSETKQMNPTGSPTNPPTGILSSKIKTPMMTLKSSKTTPKVALEIILPAKEATI